LIPEIGDVAPCKRKPVTTGNPGGREEYAGEEPEEPADYGGLNVDMISGS
jgi:hypothetical protein